MGKGGPGMTTELTATAPAGLRLLVAFYWLTGTLDVGASLLFTDALPTQLQAWFDQASGNPDVAEWLLRAWMVVLLVALIAGSLGIYRARLWGRRVFTAANVLMFASYPLLDAMVYTWFGGLFADLALLLTGSILALAYAPGYRHALR